MAILKHKKARTARGIVKALAENDRDALLEAGEEVPKSYVKVRAIHYSTHTVEGIYVAYANRGGTFQGRAPIGYHERYVMTVAYYEKL